MKKPIRKGLVSALFALGIVALVLAYKENIQQAFPTIGHSVERAFDRVGGVGEGISNAMRGAIVYLTEQKHVNLEEETTPEMIEVGAKVLVDWEREGDEYDAGRLALRVFREMLRAAPERFRQRIS